MKESNEKEKQEILAQIDQARAKLFALEEENLTKSFGKFFVKPLLLALIFGILLKYMGFEDSELIGGFLLAFFIMLFIFSLKTKKDYEKRNKIIQEEKIKTQAQIFALAKRLKEIEDENAGKTGE